MDERYEVPGDEPKSPREEAIERCLKHIEGHRDELARLNLQTLQHRELIDRTETMIGMTQKNLREAEAELERIQSAGDQSTTG